MEVSTEISHKIRSAIKAKLLELGAYVDDELPDYIMVMVANKRSRTQMSSDLGLFLGNNTNTFTEWLHSLLEKLQTIRADSDKSAGKQRKADKSKSKRKEKSQNSDVSVQASNNNGEKNNVSDNSESSHANSSRKRSNSGEEVQPGSLTEQQSEQTDENDDKSRDNIVGSYKSTEEVDEDVRQLLVTEAHEDELAEELETTDVEALTLKGSAAKSLLLQKESSTGQTISLEGPDVQSLAATRKRKVPASVVANVSRREDNDEEYDPYSPAVGSVASVVKVAARKSSLPPAMQANRLLLMKAMTEAERSVAKRKVAESKPLIHSYSDEVYSPKRKQTDESHHQKSPPPYIPSKKASISVCSSDVSSLRHGEVKLAHNDARHILSRGSERKVVPVSLHDKAVQDVRSDQGLELRSEHSIPREKDGRTKKSELKERKIDTDLQISHLSSVSQSDSRKRRRNLSPDPKKAQQISREGEYRSSIKSRLGKVIERKICAENRESIERNRNTLATKTQKDTREGVTRDLQSKEGYTKRSKGRVISSLGREAVQKQCQAAVISVQTSQTSSKTKHLSPDSRVVQCDSQSAPDRLEKTKGIEKTIERTDNAAKRPLEDVHSVIVRKSPRNAAADVSDDENEDLARMIDEDLGPELLEDADDLTLDLDVDDDLSLIQDTKEVGMQEPERDNTRLATKFIVTLDGVDEKQYYAEENKSVFDQFRQYPQRATSSALVAPFTASNSEHLLQNQNTFLNPPGHSRPASQIKVQQVQATMQAPTIPSKLTPPKIQPFSISLKDSDDEHDDKEGKPSAEGQSYQLTGGEIAGDGEASALKRAKMSERCKFWPACASGAACNYHHPTTHCKTFPNCKFGDKCLFIHPNCRFDSKCVRPDCPYTHTSRRAGIAGAGAAQVIAIPQSHLVFPAAPSRPSLQVMCRYFPNCQNMTCPFVHPKPCRFGMACKSPGCPFYHPAVPGKDRLKWQASSEQLKAAVSTTLESCLKVDPNVPRPPSPDKAGLSPAVSSTSL